MVHFILTVTFMHRNDLTFDSLSLCPNYLKTAQMTSHLTHFSLNTDDLTTDWSGLCTDDLTSQLNDTMP